MSAKREQDFFWEGVDRGELVARKCAGCGTLQHPPRPRCAKCGAQSWETQRLSGRGVIHTWVVLQHPSGDDPDPRIGILVDLEEGLRVASNLVDRENACVGAPVTVEFSDVGGQRLALFRTTRRTEREA
jgi:uncharacterized OB-fold protein